ncbi:TRAFAC clade GTPase domain-containing protein [Spirillospora sp. CA-253888]
MGIIFAILLYLAALVLEWWVLGRYVAPLLLPFAVVIVAGLLVAAYGRAAYGVLGPRPAGRDDHLIRGPGPTAGQDEPAYETYYRRQAVRDTASVVRRGARASWEAACSPPLAGTVGWLCGGEAPKGWKVVRIEGLIVPFTLPLGLLGGAALLFGGAGALVLVVAIQLVHGLALTAVAGLMLAAGLALRGLDGVRLAVRKIGLRCPYPGCFRHIALPTYHCPSGRHEHRALRPGRYGVFARVCACGVRLPTVLLLNRHRLQASCPHCARPLPKGLGSTPLLHLPLVGGASAGKTTLLMAMVTCLERLAAQGELTLEFASDRSRREFEDARRRLETGGWLNKTVDHVPHAFLLYVGEAGKRRSRRLLYLYDPRGESYNAEDGVREQQYLECTGGVVLVVDPFSAPGLRRGLPAPDERVALDAKPSQEDPMATYARFAGELGVVLTSGRRRSRRGRTPVAVVATKADAVHDLDSHAAPAAGDGEAVAAWLAGLGLGNLTRALDHDFGQVRYWALSARRSALPAAADADRRVTADPVRWLLSLS